MKLSYDPENNIAYLRLCEPGEQVQTVTLSDAVNVDLAPDGTLYGIELLNANQQLQDGGKGIIEVLNLVSGESQQLALPI